MMVKSCHKLFNPLNSMISNDFQPLKNVKKNNKTYIMSSLNDQNGQKNARWKKTLRMKANFRKVKGPKP